MLKVWINSQLHAYGPAFTSFRSNALANLVFLNFIFTDKDEVQE